MNLTSSAIEHMKNPVPQSLLNSLKKPATQLIALVLIYLVGAFFSLGLIGYGLAIQKVKPSPQLDVGALRLHEARVSSADVGWSRSAGARFKLEGVAETMVIDPDFIVNDGVWNLIKQFVRKGTNLWMKDYTKDSPDGNLVLELIANRGTAFERQIMYWNPSISQLGRRSEAYEAKGTHLIIGGILILPLLIGLNLLGVFVVKNFFGKSG